jgi:fumarate reductase flavoprotein subunit
VLVIGAGMAGSVAAARAAQLGRRVLLADAAADASSGGSTAWSGGSIHINRLPLTSALTAIRQRVDFRTGGLARQDLVSALVGHSGRALAWLLWQGVTVEPPRPGDWRTLLSPVRKQDELNAWAGQGPQRTLQRLQAVVASGGGRVCSRTRVRELIRGPRGDIAGAITDDGRRIAAGSVVLCDGGFHANAELRKRFLGPAGDRLFVRGTVSGQGDALLMAADAGAKLVNMSAFYGRCLHRDAISNDRLWPMPFLDDLLLDGLLVDASGGRLVDEGLGGIAAANAIAKTADPLGTWIVLDEEAWQSAYGRSGFSGTGGVGQPPANPEVERRGGVIHRGGSPADLARAAGIDPVGFERTIGEYRGALRGDRGGELAVPRSGHPRPPGRDLLAIPVVPSVTLTMGGVLTDSSARALDAEERPIGGLYAAGGTAGGIQGSAPGDYIGGLALALVFGLIAGEASAAGIADGAAASVTSARSVKAAGLTTGTMP